MRNKVDELTDIIDARTTELSEVYRALSLLEDDLRDWQLRHANLIAAARAALMADAEGEDDPWSYLLDELPALPPGHPLNAHRRGRS
ncbi:hypothetical protein [Longispora albida]|uniref:hypothetical protein n=1 Tax=Longispora albida TaxID=203523 RepID=UPI0012F987E5|nr:hypothetical protein [Longispora albida]